MGSCPGLTKKKGSKKPMGSRTNFIRKTTEREAQGEKEELDLWSNKEEPKGKRKSKKAAHDRRYFRPERSEGRKGGRAAGRSPKNRRKGHDITFHEGCQGGLATRGKKSVEGNNGGERGLKSWTQRKVPRNAMRKPAGKGVGREKEGVEAEAKRKCKEDGKKN